MTIFFNPAGIVAEGLFCFFFLLFFLRDGGLNLWRRWTFIFCIQGLFLVQVGFFFFALSPFFIAGWLQIPHIRFCFSVVGGYSPFVVEPTGLAASCGPGGVGYEGAGWGETYSGGEPDAAGQAALQMGHCLVFQ